LNKLLGWFAIGIFFAIAIGFPMILLGISKDYVWPVSLAAAALVMIAKPGGTVEKCLTFLLSYGIVFSVWCVAGVLAVVVLALIFPAFGPPDTIFLILAIGLFGAIRELLKEKKSPTSKI
jgi:hypothetical protein